jgi:hypothetical protein
MIMMIIMIIMIINDNKIINKKSNPIYGSNKDIGDFDFILTHRILIIKLCS